jgi:predicted phage terminase large subunit-like protein
LDALIEFARADFMCFVELTFGVLHPGTKLAHADYLDLMADLLMRVEEGARKRVIINLPPRHMKSIMVSVLYVAWRLGRDPTVKFITISYGDDLAHDLSGLTRKLMRSEIYSRIFPATVLDKHAVDYVRTTKGGYRYATSVGSDITGFGADVIIVDDPMQPDDAASESVKEKVRQWLFSSVLTRFNNPADGALILVMHRLAPDDLSATLAPNADFVLKLPLVAVETEKFIHNGKLVFHRAPGELLNPQRMNRAEVDKLKATLPDFVWNAQYQQQPTAGGSGMLSIERFKRFDLAKPPKFELLIHSWDVGGTVGGNASVCTKWGLCTTPQKQDVLYLTNVLSVRLELPEVLATIRSENKKQKPALLLIDERGLGLGIVQTLKKEGLRNLGWSSATREPLAVTPSGRTRPSDSKIDRFGLTCLYIESGKVFVPETAPWLDKFLYEVSAFPIIPDNDQVDSMSQLIANFEHAVSKARRNIRQGWC